MAQVLMLLLIWLACSQLSLAQESFGWSSGRSIDPLQQRFYAPDFTSAQPEFLAGSLAARRLVPSREVLPDGLLYRSYIASPQEPRFSSIAIYDVARKHWRWDAALGGRVGLFRQNQPLFLNLDAWQVDLEGATITRLDPQSSMDVESVDYRFGLLWTARKQNVTFKFGYFHVSSHVGDEFQLNNPTYERVNFVRESLVMGASVQATPEIRYYGEVAWASIISGGAKPWQLQMGAEYAAISGRPEDGAPFSAVNVHLREEVDFAASLTVMTGWQWTGPESGRAFRLGLQYFNGPSSQFQFFRRYDNQLGIGMWFDY